MPNDDIFVRCSEINDKLSDGRVSEARSMVIKLLDSLEKHNNFYMPLINHLIREVGLYPYMNPQTVNWEDRFAYEAFKVLKTVDIRSPKTVISVHFSYSYLWRCKFIDFRL